VRPYEAAVFDENVRIRFCFWSLRCLKLRMRCLRPEWILIGCRSLERPRSPRCKQHSKDGVHLRKPYLKHAAQVLLCNSLKIYLTRLADSEATRNLRLSRSNQSAVSLPRMNKTRFPLIYNSIYSNAHLLPSFQYAGNRKTLILGHLDLFDPSGRHKAFALSTCSFDLAPSITLVRCDQDQSLALVHTCFAFTTRFVRV